jgi:hypothetical protein
MSADELDAIGEAVPPGDLTCEVDDLFGLDGVHFTRAELARKERKQTRAGADVDDDVARCDGLLERAAVGVDADAIGYHHAVFVREVAGRLHRANHMTISSHSAVVAVDSQTSCELNAETVILDFNKGAYFGLDEIGTLIWRLIQQPQLVSALCDAVTEQYEVTRAGCEQDVIHLLETLHAEGLIEVRGASTT